METDFLASGNHFVPIAQISFLLEVVFPSRGNMFLTNPLLRPVATDFLFNGNNILSFIFFLKSLLPSERDQYLKRSYFCWWKQFSLNFSDTDSNGSSLFVHWNRIFQRILHSGSGNGFWLITNLLLLFRAFFCWWTPSLKLNVGQFLKKNNIPARWTHFLEFLQIFLRVEAAFSG